MRRCVSALCLRINAISEARGQLRGLAEEQPPCCWAHCDQRGGRSSQTTAKRLPALSRSGAIGSDTRNQAASAARDRREGLGSSLRLRPHSAALCCTSCCCRPSSLLAPPLRDTLTMPVTSSGASGFNQRKKRERLKGRGKALILFAPGGGRPALAPPLQQPRGRTIARAPRRPRASFENDVMS